MSEIDTVRVAPGARYGASARLSTSGVQRRALLSLTFWSASGAYLE
jgi:hypothetical protein